jgi:undecaprenyl-diphosphatase
MLLLVAMLSSIVQLDLGVQRAVQGARAPLLEPVMRGATGVGKPANVLGGLLAIALFDAAAGPATARLALAALVPANLLVEGLKRAVNRTRPDGDRDPSNASFPSSHAANSAALAWVLARRWRRLAPAFWALALVVAYSRMYLDRHYLSDVLAGLAIGLACGWLAPRLLARLRPAIPAPPPRPA